MISWLTFIFCFPFFAISCKKMLSGFFSILHIGLIVFFMVQVFPLIVDVLWGGTQSHLLGNMYRASIDLSVHNIYCLFCCLTIMLLFLAASFFYQSKPLVVQEQNKQNYILFFNILLVAGVFSPLAAWLLAPDPSIYFQFARFQKQSFSEYDISRLYHMIVMYKVNCVSFFSVIVLYAFNKKNMARDIVVFVGIILFSWLDGKRAFLTFALVAILIIDIVRQRYVVDKYKLIIKSAVFLVISFVFFLVYKELSEKGIEKDFYFDYQQYYSRLLCVKTAIFSVLYNQSMVDYPGQTLLYDLFFFIPRSLWSDKPVLFCKYFTSFVVNRDVGEFLPWNLQVNIWTEYIANLGVVGYFLAISVVLFVAKLSDNACNVFTRSMGMMFVSLYFMFGFEWLVLVVYVIFVFFLIYDMLKRKMSDRGKCV